MPFDGVLLHHMIKELQPLLGAQIQRVRQSIHDEFLFTCYRPGTPLQFILSAHPEEGRVHLTKRDIDETTTSHFLHILKHHIEQGTIRALHQHHNDRILVITIDKTNAVGQIETVELIAELMNRHSNLFVVKAGLIIDSLRRVPPFSEATRTVLPHTPYTYPHDTKPNPWTAFTAITFDQAMAHQGISPLLANAIEHRGVRLDHACTPRMDKQTYQYHVYDCFEDAALYPSISELLDALYFDIKKEKRHRQQIKDLTQVLTQKIQKAATKLAHLDADLEDGKQKDTWKHYGDLLYANAHKIQKGVTSVTLQDFDGVTDVFIPLQETKTPQDNAAQYFKKYQKAKKALEHIKEQQHQTRLEMEWLHQSLYDIEQASPVALQELREAQQPKKPPKHPPKKRQPHQIVHQDVVFYVGQNAKQNEVVTFELASANDLWLHVKDMPGAHVIAKTPHVTEEILRFAANLAACHSAAKHSSSVEVQYTKRKHIKKIPGFPGSVVQVKEYQTIFIDPDCPKAPS